MKESPARDALRRIQDVITHIHGSPLTGDAEKRVEEVLVRLSGAAGNTVPSENFLVREVTILLADLVMSVDNVLAVAAAADSGPPESRMLLLMIGLGLSIPLWPKG